MKQKKDESVRNDSRRTTAHVSALWSKGGARYALKNAACISLSLALAACGGNVGDDMTSEPAPPLEKTAALAAASNTVPLQLSLKMNTSGLASDASNDRFIVKYKTGTVERGSATAVQSRLDRLTNAFPSKARHVRRMGIGADVVTTERKLNVKDAKAFMRAIASDPDVEYVEPDTPMSVTMAPNDPEYSRQWGLSSNQKPGVTTAGIRAEPAWDMANGSGTVIAMVDNGVTSHSDLNANILPGYDFTTNNRGGDGTNPGITTETCEVVWHGTHVAGIMAAQTNNGIGIAGVAPAAKVVPVRVMNACGRGFTSDVADGVTWAAGGSVSGVPNNAYPAKVINVSLGGAGSCGMTFQNAIDYAASRGAVVVAAVGNNGNSATNFTPANCRNVISVGGSNRPGLKWVLSNYGQTVDIAAPGDSIWSTYNNGTAAPGSEGYTYLDGTSMAAPMVSGVIALAQSVAPTPLTSAEMRALLTQNVQAFPNGKPDQPIGSGILDASATVIAARSGRIPAAADFTCTEATTIMQVTCKDLSTARGAPIKSWAWNFGTGAPDLVRTQSVTPYMNFDYPGTYEITFTVTDSTGAISKLTRPFQVIPPTLTDLSAGSPLTISAKNGEMQNYALVVPAGVKSLTFTLSPETASQIATLYVRAGTPSSLRPDCESVMVRGGAATCTITNPVAGTYYGILSAGSKLSGVSLLATYAQ
ncbi:S8 family serine peptidase [Paraburkholderia aspalathi]|uniref:S8 family serine peptidase n=1 Tax=Paraburkholderia aspalathi TaxID=1324617 RepID=UPI0038B8D218